MQQAKNDFNEKEEALNYFKEAESLSSSSKERYLSSMLVGSSLASEEAPSERTMPGEYSRLTVAEKRELRDSYRVRQKVAAEKLREAISYGKEAGINGQTLSDVYMMMARAYRRAMTTETLNLAEQALNSVIEVYPAYQQSMIDAERTNLTNNRKDLAAEQTSRVEYERKLAKHKAQWDAYQAQQAKAKAEEEFWKGGK